MNKLGIGHQPLSFVVPLERFNRPQNWPALTAPVRPIKHAPPSHTRIKSAVMAAVPSLAPVALNASVNCGFLTACTAYSGAVLLLVIALPAKAKRALLRSGMYLLPLIAAYAYLLYHSWSPDLLSILLPGSLADGFKGGFRPQFFPSIAGISTLFGRLTTATSLWVHLLAVNLSVARSVLLEGLQERIPTVHSVMLCCMLGPVGLLSHTVTKMYYISLSTKGMEIVHH